MTVGIVACVEVTTTTSSTSPTTTTSSSATSTALTTSASSPTTSSPTSGTTTLPTSVQTTTVCQKVMAQVGGVYVSYVTYSVQPLQPTDSTQLTSNSSTTKGVSFPSVPNTTGVLDQDGQPIYSINIEFSPQGADYLASVSLAPTSNVNGFSVKYFTSNNPKQPIESSPGVAIVSTSTLINSQASVVDIPNGLPSPLSAIQIDILSTSPANE